MALKDTHRYRLQLDFKPDNVDSNQSNFPVLILGSSLVGVDISQFKSGGVDIRFSTDLNGASEVNFEIDTWNDSDLDDAILWARLPTFANVGNSPLQMWWGDASATLPAPGDSNGSEGVWDSDVVSRLSLDESSGDYLDSTSNDYDFTAESTMPNAVAGKIGSAQQFTTANNDYAVNLGDVLLMDRTNKTFEFWAKFSEEGSPFCVVFEGSTSDASGRFLLGSEAPNEDKLFIRFDDGPTVQINNARSTGDMWDGNWHHVAFVDANGSWQLYIDGVADISGSYTYAGFSLASNTALGRANTPTNYARYDGLLDETRFHKTNRSADWVTISYHMQNDPDAQVIIGTVQDLTATSTSNLRGNLTGNLRGGFQ